MEISVEFGLPLPAKLDSENDPGDWREGSGKRKLLDAMIPSLEVREHLKKQKLSLEMIQDIIGGAPVPMTEKIKWLKLYTPRVADIMQKALDALALQPGERLLMNRCWFDGTSGWDGTKRQNVGWFDTY